MKKNYYLFPLLFLLFFVSCKDEMDKNPKYQKPVWLEGKVYTVAKSIPEISLFSKCVARAGIDKLLDKSGLYTLMAPTDEAVNAYLAANNYKSIEDIDTLELKRLVEIHILLNPWSKDQLRQLNTNGWIDQDNEDTRYTGYKRESLLIPDNRDYKVLEVAGQLPVISRTGNATRKVYSAYSKYVPLFYSEYMGYSNVSSSDFKFYYDRTFENSEIYYGGAKMLSSGEDLNNDGIVDESYAAENGYVYLIDRVIEPLKSAEELLFETGTSSYQFSSFGDLINKYAVFNYNKVATYAQEGASDGLSVDNLYDISYPNLAFAIGNENTHSTPSYSIAYHNALFAPTNTAYTDFENNVLGKGDDYYGGFNTIPNVLKTLILNYHMAKWTPYYPSQAGPNGTQYNNAGDRIDLSDVNILKKYYGSNCTFVGIDKVLVPDILLSVAAPVILRQSYSYFFASIYQSGLFPVLDNLNTTYSLFAIPDEALEADSSLFITYSDDLFAGFKILTSRAYNRTSEAFQNIPSRASSGTSLRSLINGQIALGVPQGICKKEFLRTLSGYYISFDRENGQVWGGDSTKFGFMGDSVMVLHYHKELSENFGSSYGVSPANGKTFSVDHWMQFPKVVFSYGSLRNNENQLFYQLIVKAGLINSTTSRLNFLNEGDALTVFVPSDSALKAIGAETMATDKLKELILSHFITGANLFTDNVLRNPTPDNYFTANNTLLKMGSSEPDKIDVYKKNGQISFQVKENNERTNIMYLGWDNGDNTDGNSLDTKSQVGISVVVHFIDNVIQPDIVF